MGQTHVKSRPEAAKPLPAAPVTDPRAQNNAMHLEEPEPESGSVVGARLSWWLWVLGFGFLTLRILWEVVEGVLLRR